MEKKRIGFLDENKKQVAIYELLLRPYFELIGYDIHEGTSIDDLLKQVYESDISLLMVDYLLVERGVLNFNGDEFVRRYEEIKPKFPMIVFTNEESQAFPKVDDPNIIYPKSMAKVEKIGKFIKILHKNIKLYEEYIKKRKNNIEGLLLKSVTMPLDGKEKDQLTEMQFELQNLDKWSQREVPLQLLQDEKIEDLAKTAQEAEAFLQDLIKKKNAAKK